MSDLLNASACDLTRALTTGQMSAEALMAATLARIDALNPRHNAIVNLRPREALLAEAKAADAPKCAGRCMACRWRSRTLRTSPGSPQPRARRC